jgi:hypothetical protein
VGSLACGALFWLHVRYFPISFALLVGLAYGATSDRIARTARPAKRGPRERARTMVVDLKGHLVAAGKRWRTATLPVFVPYAVVLALFVAAFEHWYGSPDPRTPYYAYSKTTLGGGGLQAVYDYVLHDLFNPLVGWIPFAPVHWLGLAALGCVVVWFGWPAAACIAVAAGYELILASSAPVGGWGLPARYLLIVIPLIAVPIAVAIQQIRLARVVFVPLLAGSLLLTVAALRDFEGLYPAGEGQQIVGLRSIATAFPVTLPPQPATSLAAIPGQSPSQTGRLQRGRIVAKTGRDRPGFALYGAYSTLKRGAYRARFSLAATGVRDNELVAIIEVIGQGETVLGREVVTGRKLLPVLSDFDLSFTTPGDDAIEARVYYRGRGSLEVGPAYVESLAPSTPPSHFRDWPLAFLWVAGTVLIGALFVQVMKLSGRSVAS